MGNLAWPVLVTEGSHCGWNEVIRGRGLMEQELQEQPFDEPKQHRESVAEIVH